MAEVTLHCEEKWALMFMGKVIALWMLEHGYQIDEENPNDTL
jgi:hypothetical protein